MATSRKHRGAGPAAAAAAPVPVATLSTPPPQLISPPPADSRHHSRRRRAPPRVELLAPGQQATKWSSDYVSMESGAAMRRATGGRGSEEHVRAEHPTGPDGCGVARGDGACERARHGGAWAEAPCIRERHRQVRVARTAPKEACQRIEFQGVRQHGHTHLRRGRCSDVSRAMPSDPARNSGATIASPPRALAS